MNIKNSILAMEGWGIEALEEIQGEGSPVRIIKLLNNINSEGRKLEYRGSGLQRIKKTIEKADELILGVEKTEAKNDRQVSDYMSYIDVLSDYIRRSYEHIKDRISQSRAAAQQIIAMMEKVRKNEKIRKQEYNKAVKFASSMVNSLQIAERKLIIKIPARSYTGLKGEHPIDKYTTALIRETNSLRSLVKKFNKRKLKAA